MPPGAAPCPRLRCVVSLVLIDSSLLFLESEVPARPGNLVARSPKHGRFAASRFVSCVPQRSRRVRVAEVLAFRLLPLVEPVAEQLAVERRGVDPEDFARPLLLPPGVVQDLED